MVGRHQLLGNRGGSTEGACSDQDKTITRIEKLSRVPLFYPYES